MNTTLFFFRKSKISFGKVPLVLVLILFNTTIFSNNSTISKSSCSKKAAVEKIAYKDVSDNGSIRKASSKKSIPSLAQGFIGATKPTKSNSAGVENKTVIGDDFHFLKTTRPLSKTAIDIEKSRVWLNMTNTQGAFKQLVVGYITGATNDYEDAFDVISYDGNPFIDFYSVLQARNLTIQGRALPFDANDVVPVGYRSAISGSFTITIYDTDGLLSNQGIYLEDKLTGNTANLRSGPYTFNTEIGTFRDRFVLRYKNPLATNDFKLNENKVVVSCKDKQIHVNAASEMIQNVVIYNLLGRTIYAKENVNRNELTISDLIVDHQIVVVKTKLQNGVVISKKIAF